MPTGPPAVERVASSPNPLLKAVSSGAGGIVEGTTTTGGGGGGTLTPIDHPGAKILHY